jgi:hypothetical protein
LTVLHWGNSSLVAGRRLLAIAAAFGLLAAGLAAGAVAQRMAPTVPTLPPQVVAPPVVPLPPGGGVGGGAGLIGTLPQGPAAPAVTPQPSAPVAVPTAPVAPGSVVRLRCEVAPQAESCKEALNVDGGGGDEECRCGRDYCYYTETGTHICEKQ